MDFINRHRATKRLSLAGAIGACALLLAGCGGGGGGSSTETAPAPIFSFTVNKQAIDFGSTVVGQEVPSSVLVKNTGNRTLNVSAQLTGDSTFGSLSVDGCASLAPYAECLVNLVFVASDRGSYTATLSISANGASTRTVALSAIAREINVQITSVGLSCENPLTATVSVTDSFGHPIPGLLEEYFSAFLSGSANASAINVSEPSIGRKPVAVMLAVDWSDSASANRQAVIDATRLFIDSLGEDDRLGLLRFAQEVEQDEDYGLDSYRLPLASAERKQALKDKLNSDFELTTAGSAIWDAVQTSRQAVDQESQDTYTRVVILLSDGVDNQDGNLQDTIARAGYTNTLVYTIGFEGTTGFNLDDLRELSDATGGLPFASLDANQLSQYYVSINDSLAGTFDLLIPNPGLDANALKVVVDPGGDTGEDVRPVSSFGCPG